MKDALYLMKPGFLNAGLGPLYCRDSVSVEGMLGFFPMLRELVDVHYIDFPRPRLALVARLGEAHQSVPVLILGNEGLAESADNPPRLSGDVRFFDDEQNIRKYLSERFSLPQAS